MEAAEQVFECKARGIFRKKGSSPYVGDTVEISVPKEGYAVIEEICPRKNSLVRPPLANLDILVIVCSVTDPAPNCLVVDKMIAAAENKNIQPAVVVSKTDLQDCGDFMRIYQQAGIETIEFSAVTGQGCDKVINMLKYKTSAFIGNSGVGKSTLLNTMFPDLNLETGEISQKLGRGRHTTRTVELYRKNGGYIADTPGFSTVDLERYEVIDKNDLQYCFQEFAPYLGRCKFNSCLHLCEKGCAVIDAVEKGEISKSRHNSYIAMYNEVKDLKPWEMK